MSLITKNNYEAFLLDYVEGNLSPEHTAELMLFFENHPELKEDLEEFEIITLTPENVDLQEKEHLKIKDEELGFINYEDAIISEIEGENSRNESLVLASFLDKNPEKKKELEAYQKTKLIAPTITFNSKAELKQKEAKVIPLYWWYTAAAAVILALFLLKGINSGNNQLEELPIAEEINNSTEPKNNVPKNVEPKIKERKNLAANESQNLAQEKEQDNSLKELPNKKEIVKNPIQIETINEEPILANEIKHVIKDTSISNPANKKEQKLEEEILYADDVVIVFEDEIIDTSSINTSNKKPTKFNAVAAALKQEVKEKWLKKDNGEPLLSLNNSGLFRLFKGKNK